jgi:hypothetical protein
MNFDTSHLFEGHAAGGGNGEGPPAGEPAHKLVKRGTLKTVIATREVFVLCAFTKGEKRQGHHIHALRVTKTIIPSVFSKITLRQKRNSTLKFKVTLRRTLFFLGWNHIEKRAKSGQR